MILLHTPYPSNHLFDRHNNNDKNVNITASCNNNLDPTLISTSNNRKQNPSKMNKHTFTPNFSINSLETTKEINNYNNSNNNNNNNNNQIINSYHISNFISRMLAFYFNSHGLRVHTRRYRIKRCIMAVTQPLLHRHHIPLLPVNTDEFKEVIVKMLRHTRTENITGMMALMFFDRFVNADPDALCTTGQFLRWYGICLMLACKVNEDRFVKNIRWTRMMRDAGANLSLKEINHMEMNLLGIFNWEVFIPLEDLEEYLMNCCKVCPANKELPDSFCFELFHCLGIRHPQDKKKVSFKNQENEVIVCEENYNRMGMAGSKFKRHLYNSQDASMTDNNLERSSSSVTSETVLDSYSSCSPPSSSLSTNMMIDQNDNNNNNNDNNNINETNDIIFNLDFNKTNYYCNKMHDSSAQFPVK